MGRKKGEITKTEKQKAERAYSLQFTDWLYEVYDVSYLPKHFFMQLQQVYKGTYKNLKQPVPIEDLWDMWRKKLPYLLKTYENNKSRGKDMEGMARINYDLAILLSRYESYLKWKEGQKQMQAEEQSQTEKISVDYSRITASASQKSDTDRIDINSIIDEI